MGIGVIFAPLYDDRERIQDRTRECNAWAEMKFGMTIPPELHRDLDSLPSRERILGGVSVLGIGDAKPIYADCYRNPIYAAMAGGIADCLAKYVPSDSEEGAFSNRSLAALAYMRTLDPACWVAIYYD